jgi:hypothetical protein
MKSNIEIDKLKGKAENLLNCDDFKELSVVFLAMVLERILKKAIVFNYRKAGISASFIRKRLLDKMSYAQLITEFECSSPDKVNLNKIWKSKKMKVKDLSGIMKVRNNVIHSNGNVPLKEIQKSVKELLYVIENLTAIFTVSIGYNGFEPLPKTFPKNQLKLTSKMLHKSIVANFHKSK